MYDKDLFAGAKKTIIGSPPQNGLEMIGYRIASNYFEPLIDEAEPILLGLEVPRKSFDLYLKNAFDFSSYSGFGNFPPETRNIITSCTTRFRKRYEPLFNKLHLRAAAGMR